MKKLLVMTALLGVACYSFGQGALNFANTSGTLISAGGTATPARTGTASSQYIAALFVNAQGTAAPTNYTDAAWQTVGAYANNWTAGTGRFSASATSASVAPVALANYTPGSTVSLIVRAWSANAGATWAEALAFYNNGTPAADMFLGQSIFSAQFPLGGGALPTPALFGAALPTIGGFNMALVPGGPIIPEPSSMVLAGLGAASLLLFRRRK